DGFAESLSELNEVILLDIYPARELPIEGITSAMLLDKIISADKLLLGKKEVVEDLKDRQLEVLLTLGAGDIDELVKPIKEGLEARI
ncbi:MAG: UDP-N-acetylmuramate--alanine ligase, partial [Parvicellaceae bacterium]